MAAKRRLVLTFDAFGTLFRPKRPVHEQYADLARKHGLSGFTDEEVGHNFKLGMYKSPFHDDDRTGTARDIFLSLGLRFEDLLD